MKNIIYSLLSVLFIIASCSDDSVSPPGQTETLIYSFDSLGISSSDSGIYFLDTSKLVQINNASNIRIEFTGETNIDSSMGQFYVHVSVSDSINFTFVEKIWTSVKTEFCKLHNFNVHLPINMCIISIQCIIFDTHNYQFKFIRIRNFKVFRID